MDENEKKQEAFKQVNNDAKRREEIKRQKLIEAINKNDVYNNLVEIEGVNGSAILESIIVDYMDNHEDKLDLDPTAIQINTADLVKTIDKVRRNEVDLVKNGIVTNADGTKNKIDSAIQEAEREGVTLSDILNNSKEDSFADSILKEITGERELDIEDSFSTFINSIKENSYLDTNEESFRKLFETARTQAEKGVELFEEEQQDALDSYIDNIEDLDFLKAYYSCMVKGFKVEEYKEKLEKFVQKHPDNRFVKAIQVDGKVEPQDAIEFIKKWQTKYNESKNVDDLQEYINEGETIDLSDLTEGQSKKMLADILIGTMSSKEEAKYNANILANRLRFRGKRILPEDIKLTPEMAINVLNAHSNVKYTFGDKKLEYLLRSRELNGLTFRRKYNSIKSSLEFLGEDNRTEKGTLKDEVINQKVKKKVSKELDPLQRVSKEIDFYEKRLPERFVDKEIGDLLESIELKGPNCANAMAIKVLYAKACEHDYIERYGKLPPPEEEMNIYRMRQKGTASNAILLYMKQNVAIFGDVINGMRGVDYQNLSKMLEENPLQNAKGNVNVDKLMKKVIAARDVGREEDKAVVKDMEAVKKHIKLFKALERDEDGKLRKPEELNTEEIQKKREETIELMRKIPLNQFTIKYAAANYFKELSPETKKVFMEEILKMMKENDRNPNVTSKDKESTLKKTKVKDEKTKQTEAKKEEKALAVQSKSRISKMFEGIKNLISKGREKVANFSQSAISNLGNAVAQNTNKQNLQPAHAETIATPRKSTSYS